MNLVQEMEKNWNWIYFVNDERNDDRLRTRTVKFILSMQRYRNQRYKVTNKVYVLRVYTRDIYTHYVFERMYSGNENSRE